MEETVRCERVTISGDAFKMDGQEVILMGANYVMKSDPFFPPLEIIRSDAKVLADGAKSMEYKPPVAADGTARRVLPCVRLGTCMDAAMPSSNREIDASFVSKLEGCIKAFRDEGVYVFCDIHTDSISTTSGGDGVPWWVTADFQDRAGCFMEQCCCCCCFSYCSCCPECCRTSYVTNPSHPLQPFCGAPNCLMSCFKLGITKYDGDADPWKAHAVGAGAGNPAHMNVGNASMRKNNSDEHWHSLYVTAQVQNSAKRLYGSAHNQADKQIFFDPYVKFVKYLCSLWDKYENVVAVELLNEPPLGGLPNLCYSFSIWRQVAGFFGDVLEDLSADPSIKCPIAVTNFGSAAPASERTFRCLALAGVPSHAKKHFQLLAQQNRLIFSFHYYVPPLTASFQATVDAAKKFAAESLHGAPIWLSEFFEDCPQKTADQMAMAVDLGLNAVTYWNYADTDFTGQPGWWKYPPAVLSAGTGEPVNEHGQIDPLAFAEHAKTVIAESHFGADITGSGGAQKYVLGLVPARYEGQKDVPPAWPKGCTRFHKPVRRLKADTPEASMWRHVSLILSPFVVAGPQRLPPAQVPTACPRWHRRVHGKRKPPSVVWIDVADHVLLQLHRNAFKRSWICFLFLLVFFIRLLAKYFARWSYFRMFDR